MKKIIHHDIYIGIVFLLFSIFFLNNTFSLSKEAALFPKFLLTIMIIFSVLMVITGMKKTKDLNEGKVEKDNSLSFSTTKIPLLAFLIIAVYGVLVDFLGFFTSSALFLVAFMLVFRVRNWKKILLSVVSVSALVYLIFLVWLKVPLPDGILF